MKRSAPIITLIVLTGMCLASIIMLAPRAWADIGSISIPASQDAFVDLNNPNVTYDDQRLDMTYSHLINLTSTRKSVIQFSLAGISSSPTEVAFELTVVENLIPEGGSVDIAIFELEDNWTETGITWNLFPAVGDQLQTVTVLGGDLGALTFSGPAINQYVEAERTGDGIVSFLAIISGGEGDLGFAGVVLVEDREGSHDGINGNEPKLILQGIDATATPTFTPTWTSTPTDEATPTMTSTATPTVMPTATPTMTPTATPTATLTPTATSTLSPTPVGTVITPVVTITSTPAVTPTSTIPAQQDGRLFLPLIRR